MPIAFFGGAWDFVEKVRVTNANLLPRNIFDVILLPTIKLETKNPTTTTNQTTSIL